MDEYRQTSKQISTKLVNHNIKYGQNNKILKPIRGSLFKKDILDST